MLVPSRSTSARPLRVLAAEDSEITQLILAEVLTSAGHRVDFVGDGVAAVMAFRTGGYDLVLLARRIPLMDGLAAARAIREHEVQSADDVDGLVPVPIIALAAKVTGGDEESAEAGIDATLPRSFAPAELLGLIERLVSPPPPSTAQGDTPAAAAVDQDPINVEALLHRCGGDVRFAQTLVGRFVSSAEHVDTTVRDAWRSGDRSRVAHHAHAMKGSAAYLSAPRLQSLAGTLEELCRRPDAGDVEIHAAADAFHIELRRCLAAVPKLFARLADVGNGGVPSSVVPAA